MTEETKELLRCPFCGGEPSMESEHTGHHVRCLSCEQPFRQTTEYLAAKYWNTRVPQPSERSKIDELVNTLRETHKAIDILFAMLIQRSPCEDMFYPSKSGQPLDAACKAYDLIKYYETLKS